MARSGDAARPGGGSAPGEGAPDGPEAPAHAIEVLSRVVEEQRRAQAALQERFLEHGLVDQAVGMLSARLECGPQEAFEQLLELERRSGRDLVEVAAEVLGRQTEARSRAPLEQAVPVYGPGLSRLERSADADELARTLLADTLAWSGAMEAAVALIQPDGALELAGSAGLALRVASQWRRIPPQFDCLLNAAVREQAAVWADAAAEGHGGPPVLGPAGSGAVSPNPVHVAVPLRLGRGLVGAVEVGWPANTVFTAEVRHEIVGLLESAGHALVRARRLPAASPGPESALGGAVGARNEADFDRLREIVDAVWEPALLLGPIPDAQDRVGGLQVLAVNRAARTLLAAGSGTPDPVGRPLLEALPWAAASGGFDALRRVLITGTPLRDAAHSYPDVSDGEGRIRAISLSAARLADSLLFVALRPAEEPRGDHESVAARLRRMAGTGSWEWDAAAGVVHWSAEALMAFGARIVPGPVPQDRPPYTVHPDDQLEHDRLMRTLTRDGRPAQGEFRVVRPGGTVRHLRIVGEPLVGPDGAVSSVFGTVQDVTERRRAQTALEIANIQLAAQRSRAESERQLANLLQQVIMPVEPIRVPQTAALEVAARYRPASAGAGVGGDWYGIFPVPDARLLMTVGDIAGHGFAAATAMAQLFHALHGLALTGADSGQLLRWLNTVTCSLPAFTIASACVALYDPADRTLCVANAGHPSPVLVREEGAATIPRPAGAMLGIDAGSEYDEASVILEAGDVLLLYTDGLIERRRHSPDENVARLLAEASPAEDHLDAYVDRLLERAESDTDDDVAVLAVRFN
jgi:serine phosphatase RsbU (regulator of sigma subunit)/PAS domain-containing protein